MNVIKIIIIGFAILLTISIAILAFTTLNQEAAWEMELSNSLNNHTSWKGHPWYIAPMEGKTIQLYNGSVYQVNSDHWDSCEHNPQQGHLIGIGYTNKTAFDERRLLDQDFMTRNYTATYQTILWENATLVARVFN
jgi:hypothetical protein